MTGPLPHHWLYDLPESGGHATLGEVVAAPTEVRWLAAVRVDPRRNASGAVLIPVWLDLLRSAVYRLTPSRVNGDRVLAAALADRDLFESLRAVIAMHEQNLITGVEARAAVYALERP